MEKIILTRLELYDMVWTSSIRSLSKKFGISEIELRRICKKASIPLPVNGYWSKIQFNKPVAKTELPESNTKEERIIIKNDVSVDDPSSADYIQKKITEELGDHSEQLLKVPERLINPDRLIINAKNYHDAIKRYNWRTDGAPPKGDDRISIDVSEDSFPRALRLMDTIIKLLRFRNHSFITKYGDTKALIYGEEIEFRLRERNKVSEVKDRWGGRQFEPTGEFTLIFGPNYRMKEIKDGKELLENKLVKILLKFESIGKQEHDERIERDIRRKEQEEKERISKLAKERKEKELDNFKTLLKEANRWKQATILREYIMEVEKEAVKNGTTSEEFNDWLTWAKQKVEWFDPLYNKNDLYLTDTDKQNSLI